MDSETPRLFAVSKRIQKVLHHPDFDPNEVDHNMHKRLMAAVEEGDLQVIDLKEDGDGEQDVRLFRQST